MGEHFSCYRCGHSLDALPFPLGRRDLCLGCSAELHVCRMCRMYAPAEPEECAEEDAVHVADKERANFCDYFKPSPAAFSGEFLEAQTRAKAELAALFGEGSRGASGDAPGDLREGSGPRNDPLTRAEELFKS